MPRKIETVKIIVLLEKEFRRTKKMIWMDIARRLKKSRRQRPSINLWKLERLSKAFDGKFLVVPGKVLGKGEIQKKIRVIALEYSESAKKQIGNKGVALSFDEAIKNKIKPSEMVIVK